MFESLRKLAIRKISCNATQQIVLGRKYSVHSWVEAGYKGIVASRNISDEQMEEIGLLESFKLLRITVVGIQKSNYSSPDNEIKKIFHEELESIAAAEEAILTHDLNSRSKGNKS